MHPFNRRLLAEELVRVRRADDRHRYAASQRQARIDPNPHQIDAVIFALRRLPEGGCILADEVGLGKTIEAGLVIAQRLAEGARRVLLMVPKALIGQWVQELHNLFALRVQEEQADFTPPGVYVVSRDFAGGQKGALPLGSAPPFDLVVIDEAHEVFAALHKRYTREGFHDPSSGEALTAFRVRQFLRTAPVLLLTATPIQNSLAELWGLVQYVEPTGTLLGDIATFRKVFCAEDDRTLAPGQEHELQRRLSIVCQRTLRRQAQEFLDRPFMKRRCRLYEYPMSSDERSLYDDVTEYLLEPSLYAFAGRQRRLLLIGFHRRMASSISALAASLEGVAARLRRLLGQDSEPAHQGDWTDLEDEEELSEAPEESPQAGGAGVAAELARVESFIARARALPSDAKARTFLEALRVVHSLGAEGRSSGKAVVFTESITTQEYLRQLLIDEGLNDQEITLFRGQNDHPRAREALQRWQAEEAGRLPANARPSLEVAVRLALVHEFRTRSQVLIATEAGAKGLNLQFCDTVINYDLPWNPQRIEQRIGRCHRYSQQRDVTVVNFIAKDNEAHKLTFEILARKLDLFGRVLDASDTVLHEPRTDTPEPVVSALSIEFETDLRNIYNRSRTLEEVTSQIAALRDRIVERRESYEREHARTSQIIESRFDDEVQRVFRGLKERLPAGLARLDADLAELVGGYLETQPHRRSLQEGRVWFELEEGARLPAEVGAGRVFATGDGRDLSGAEALNLAHPLVRLAVTRAQAWPGGAVTLSSDDPRWEPWLGRSGVLAVSRVDYAGFEPVQRLVAAAVVAGQPMEPELAAALTRLPASEAPDLQVEADEPLLADLVEEAVFVDQREVELEEQKHFEVALGQLERFVEDRILIARRERAAISEKLRAARERRDQVVGSDARTRVEQEIQRLALREQELTSRIEALESREDKEYQVWRTQYQQRRYQPPVVNRLFAVTFRIQGTKRSC